ncbi:hypothetical protein ACRRU2_21675 [Paenibacillus sp. GXUN7292]
MIKWKDGRLMNGKKLQLEAIELKDAETGLVYKSIGCIGSNTAHSYFTVMSWRADSRHIIAAIDVDAATMKGTMLDVDTTGDSCWGTLLHKEMLCFNGLATADDMYYYSIGADIFELALKSGERRLVASHPQGCAFLEPLSITNDKSCLGVYWENNGVFTIGTVDVADGKVRTVIEPGFAKPYSVANHAMINPVYKEQLFFAHEGDTEQIYDRIWSVHTETGEAVNLYKQQWLPDGSAHGEYIGHEMWSYDGKWLYFVRYAHSPLGSSGIYRVKRDGSKSEYINGDFRYWHACPSPDGRYIVADTLLDEGKGSEIVLIDLKTGSSCKLCRVNRWNRHPGHPHPAFSPDSRKIIFTHADENNDLRIGIIALE